MAKEAPRERLITRYLNRKLYEPAARRYVTLADLARMVVAGDELRVVDQKTSEDLTAIVLGQVLFEQLKERTSSIPRPVLTRLIRLAASGVALPDLGAPVAAAARARDEAERIATRLLARGRLSIEEALGLRQEIAHSVQRIVSEAQHALDQRLRGALEHSAREDAASPALQALRARLMSFATSLDEQSVQQAGVRKPRTAGAGRAGARGSKSTSIR